MRCQVVSLQEKPWCTSFRRQVNKHSEEEAKFIWLTFGICKVGLKFLEYETFESYTLCHHQELARGALKQCRETWASSLPFLPTSRSAAALAEPHIVRSAWESSIFLALVDWGRTCCRMTWTAMTQTTRWTVTFLTICPECIWGWGLQVWNASVLTKHAGGCPWPPLLSSPQGKACDEDQAELQGWGHQEVALDPPCWVHPRAKLVIKIKLNYKDKDFSMW